MTGLDVEAVLRKALLPEYGCICATYDGPQPCHCDEEMVAHVAAVLRVEIEAALAGERERAAWEVQRVINHWSSVPADVLADRFAELADLEACRDRITNPYRPTLAATEGDRQ